jgi:hypothetical protein
MAGNADRLPANVPAPSDSWIQNLQNVIPYTKALLAPVTSEVQTLSGRGMGQASQDFGQSVRDWFGPKTDRMPAPGGSPGAGDGRGGSNQ